eukprot:356984-Prymnesium_polylepis.1
MREALVLSLYHVGARLGTFFACPPGMTQSLGIPRPSLGRFCSAVGPPGISHTAPCGGVTAHT